MLSPPSLPSLEVVHYYVEMTNWETTNFNHNEDEDGEAEHNLDALNQSTSFEIEDEQMLCSKGSLRNFLKLLVERVTKRVIPSDNRTLRLGKKSQILTSNEYIIFQEL